MSPDPDNPSEQQKREQILSKLPLVISSVSPQKKNPDRFSLYHEKTFLIGVSSQSMLDFQINKGIKLTRTLFMQIIDSEEYQSAKDRAYRLLSGRDHGAEELRRKLIKKGFSPESTRRVIDEFSDKNLLNEQTYAKKFAADKFQLRQWGPKKIEAALYNKGVPKNVIQDVIQNLKADIDQKDACLELALKRRKHFLREPDIYKRKQKIFRYLAGKGYSPDSIQRSLPKIIEQLNA
ncbi:regulatory protein RecX [Rhodohalobacter sp. SW132]|uniref:regulatory protein RecX n=1 Tax=Rhodohalobacter sp. SW132 TaxID=2293433 RepID=UPI000E23ADEC|nr:regulatory protein RecX [Rhodohalobacter sp. SW132]REL33105.1 regulatory protein RecX [Rhodohalobacter sp. SW132]